VCAINFKITNFYAHLNIATSGLLQNNFYAYNGVILYSVSK